MGFRLLHICFKQNSTIMKQIQFIAVTPEQLITAIDDSVRKQIDNLTSSFKPIEPTEWLTRNEVKDLFKVDLSTIHHWTKKGKLKAYGIGGRVYYKRSEIEESLIPIS